MKMRENRLILIWFFCVSVISFACTVAYFQGWWGMLNDGDHTKLSFVNLGMFVAGLIVNGRNAFWINRELKISMKIKDLCEKGLLKNEISAEAWKNGKSSLVSSHILNLKKIAMKQKSGDIDQTPLVDIMAAELETPETWTRYIAMALASLGLFATLVGFVISMNGLDILMGMDKATMLQGLRKAINGMSTAFYATLVAVIFGAVCLEMFHRLVSNAITKVLITVAKVGEVYIIPDLKSQFKENPTLGESSETKK